MYLKITKFTPKTSTKIDNINYILRENIYSLIERPPARF